VWHHTLYSCLHPIPPCIFSIFSVLLFISNSVLSYLLFCWLTDLNQLLSFLQFRKAPRRELPLTTPFIPPWCKCLGMSQYEISFTLQVTLLLCTLIQVYVHNLSLQIYFVDKEGICPAFCMVLDNIAHLLAVPVRKRLTD
jgi:hypothetical protein